MTSPTSPKQEKAEEDPFADIMSKLKSQQKPKSASEYTNLMDEEPPETLKQFNEPSDRKTSPIKTKQSEPSSFIKAAFASKSKEEMIIFQNEPLDQETSENANIHFETKAESKPETEAVSNDFPELMEEFKSMESEEKELEIITEKESLIEEDRLLPEIIKDEIYTEHDKNPLESHKEHLGYQNEEKGLTSNEISQSNGFSGFLQQPEIVSSSTSTIPFFDSFSSIIGNSDNSSISSPSTSSIKSPTSPQTKSTGFRASILKHGLSALEKIGKSTADVVVSTRNKLAEPSMNQYAPGQQPITPDYSDEISTFYDILKLYGGYAKLQVPHSILILHFYLLIVFRNCS